jgi:hypothetical protein
MPAPNKEKPMKFTTEELSEMRKLAGIDYAAVDYRRPQDFLSEAREPVSGAVAEAMPAHEMPKKSVPTKPSKLWVSKGSKTTLKALLAKHKAPKEAGTNRKPAIEQPAGKDAVPPKG